MSTQRAVQHSLQSLSPSPANHLQGDTGGDEVDDKSPHHTPTQLVNIEEVTADAAAESIETKLPALSHKASWSDEAANDVGLAEASEVVGKATRPGAEESGSRLFREDPRLDRRIIDGMLNDRDAFMEKMAREGYAAGAILRRAAELGLSEALVRQVKGVAADLAGERPGRRAAPASLGARTCLSCDRVFLSSGPGNRLCMRCRGGDAGLAQL